MLFRSENGRAVIDEEQAATVREFFQNYISGMALMPAAEKAGLKLYHGSAGRMLRNKKYLGDDYYPAIIDKETFDISDEEIRKRLTAYKLGLLKLTKLTKAIRGFVYDTYQKYKAEGE